MTTMTPRTMTLTLFKISEETGNAAAGAAQIKEMIKIKELKEAMSELAAERMVPQKNSAGNKFVILPMPPQPLS